MADLTPGTLAKFRKLQLMLADSPEIMEALKSPQLLALAAGLPPPPSISAEQQLPPPPSIVSEPEPNYPTIGVGHSDDVSVMSEMTTPTVMTRQQVFDEEFYPEVDRKGTSTSGIGGPRRPPIQQIGARPYEDGVLPPPPPAGGRKTKNKVSLARPGAARAIARHTKAEPTMSKIREDDVSSKSSASSASELRADLKKRPPPLTARNAFGKSKSPSADLDFEFELNKSKNRSGTNGRGMKPSRSMPTKFVTGTSNHSSTSKRSNSGSSYASSDDDDGDIVFDISTCIDAENSDDKKEVDKQKSNPSPASSGRSKNSKSTTKKLSSRSNGGVTIQSDRKSGRGRSVPKMKLVPLKYKVNKGNDGDNSGRYSTAEEKISVQHVNANAQMSKTINDKNADQAPRRASSHTKTPTIKTSDNRTKTETKGIELVKKIKKPTKAKISPKPPHKTESSFPEENSLNINTVKTNFAIIEERSIEERQGTTSRPDDYLPGTDPFAHTRKKKERSKKKYGDPSSSGTSNRVDEWLGSGKTSKRTWKVKEKKTEKNAA
mmetsp:Transcript_27725/g.31111  ORF Transcript_27725/g.31111 Transcript_27725/m.31111 type:complete len:547 (-) Transcript_27725:287-1927(-)|eukprot:CAMPEP_0170773224 /NCGR_PEP_ID=MMETSP0733-20121128/9254_1 /TAXON_ID=186038 /ORGANISM="Fragilariopsis kerguelensis, Strain L26-C5" /LENGTH=546 /DNA_ID=CAMNT_0011115587 /DNA_START=77 /DNA_END=1717 /DNA_ORIENTATION=+